MHLADEVLQHLLGVGEIRDHAILHGAHCGDVAGRTPEHVLGVDADSDDDLAAAAEIVLHGDDRRLVKHDATIAHVDEGVGRTQIDRQIAGEVAAQAFEHRSGTSLGKREKRPSNLATRASFHKATMV